MRFAEIVRLFFPAKLLCPITNETMDVDWIWGFILGPK